ncbi:MAG TPA: CbtA family protein [Nitrososphaeraceae archaeon]|nr:CbtA family protein [Nitrososphaeraceae archaeon]
MWKDRLRTFAFVTITLLSGAIAGTILGLLNQALVEPYIDRAISIETQNAIKKGEVIYPVELQKYRLWQKAGEIAAGTILGTSLGALFGIVFVYSRSSLLLLHSNSNVKKALVLAGIMWFVLFLIPALKYPANPPAVGDPDTIYYRESLYIGLLTISGFSALGLALLYRVLGNRTNNKNRTIVVSVIYAAIIVGAFLVLPPNPDKITAPTDLVQGFRIASAFTMATFWGLLAITLGAFWDRFKVHETAVRDLSG